jgi:CubicO group peptidase (beta-lactamase class C family)
MPEAVAGTQEVFGRSIIRRAVIPGAGGIYKASSVARFFALLAGEGELDGVRLLSPERVNYCLTPRPDTEEVDVAGGNVRLVTNGGFWLDAPGVVGSGRILSHPGLGGSIGWADLDNRLGVSMCHNRHGLAYEKPLAEAMGRAFGVA